jgi:hypothetical protein
LQGAFGGKAVQYEETDSSRQAPIMNVVLRVFVVMFTISVAAGLSNRPALAQASSTQVQVYPAPAGAPLSPQFTVLIRESGLLWVQSPAYETQNPFPLLQPRQPPFERTTAWTSFATDTPVTVQVANDKPFASARILPSSAKIEPTLSGFNGRHYKTVSFTLGGRGPQQVSVEFCYTKSPCNEKTQMLRDIDNPLLIFVNPLSANVQPSTKSEVLTALSNGTVPPLSESQTMVSFPPGLYDLGPTPYQLPSGKQAFLAGGAYVKGMFAIGDKSSITGLGVLSGEVCIQPKGPNTCPMMIAAPAPPGFQPKPTSGVTLSGITLVNAPHYNILLGGTDNTVSNIKVMSWLANTDGISTGSGSLSDSFFKTGDDAIKLYSSNFTVSGCTMWHLGNAAPFELGVNLSEPKLTNIKVQNCDVIRTEWIYPNRSNAVFSAAFGGNTNSSGYLFDNIRIENTNTEGFEADKAGSVFQLFKLAVIPNSYTEVGNNGLGSISGVTFSNIQVTDSVTLPNLFQSFDWKHKVSGINFDKVTVAGQTLQQPTPTYNANRNFSLSGTVFSSILWRQTSDPTSFLADVFNGATGGLPVTPPTPLSASSLAGSEKAWAIGDVDGRGLASVLFLETTPSGNGIYGVWDQPLSPSPQVVEILKYDSGSGPAGIGDFNGDGRSDMLLWNRASQTATLVLMGGATAAGIYYAMPPPPAKGKWSVAGVGDIDQNGYSDIILRDQEGNVGVLSYAGGPTPTWQPLPLSQFSYANGLFFDSNWQVAAVGDVRGNGYASIVWFNKTTCQVGVTGFAFSAPPKAVTSTVLGTTTPNCAPIAATGDYNGDGTMDLLLVDSSGQQTIWYMEYNGGALYLAGPTLSPQAGYTLVP